MNNPYSDKELMKMLIAFLASAVIGLLIIMCILVKENQKPPERMPEHIKPSNSFLMPDEPYITTIMWGEYIVRRKSEMDGIGIVY